jgi:hypothetical protein
LYRKRGDLVCGAKHFLLQVAGCVPGGLAAGGGIHGKHQARLFFDKLRDRLTFMQEAFYLGSGG